MLEATGRCPFRDACESHRDLSRIQGKLYKERRESVSETSSIERVEIDEVMRDYEKKFRRLRRIEERCSSYYVRCLRYWQKMRLEDLDVPSDQSIHDWITQVTTE